MIDWAGVARDIREGRPGPECDRICGTCSRFTDAVAFRVAAHDGAVTFEVGHCGLRPGEIRGETDEGCELWLEDA